MLTQERLKELLNYDPETGIFTRRISLHHCCKVGDIAGYIRPRGDIRIRVEKVLYLAHRLAWLYVHGEWPKLVIDHIDGNPSNNKISNLRDVDISTNMQNQRKPTVVNSSGYLGVYKRPNGKRWLSNIGVSKKKKHLGSFDSPEEAYEAYLAAKRKYHIGCTI